MCTFLGSVLSQQKFKVTDGPVLKPHVTFSDRPVFTAPCYSSVLFRNQRKIHPPGVRVGRAKKQEEKRSPRLLFLCFFLLPPVLLYINRASQECCLFYLRSSLQSLDCPLLYFCGLFPSLSFSHCHSGLLSPILTT